MTDWTHDRLKEEALQAKLDEIYQAIQRLNKR